MSQGGMFDAMEDLAEQPQPKLQAKYVKQITRGRGYLAHSLIVESELSRTDFLRHYKFDVQLRTNQCSYFPAPTITWHECLDKLLADTGIGCKIWYLKWRNVDGCVEVTYLPRHGPKVADYVYLIEHGTPLELLGDVAID